MPMPNTRSRRFHGFLSGAGKERSHGYSSSGSTKMTIAWWLSKRVQATDASNRYHYSAHHGLRGSDRSSAVREVEQQARPEPGGFGDGFYV